MTSFRINGYTNPWFVLFLLALGPILNGCLYYGQYGTRPAPTEQFSIDPDYFRLESPAIAPEFISVQKQNGYEIRKLRFQDHTAFLYLPRPLKRHPAILVLPITQGDSYTKQMAHRLAQEGYVALRFRSHGHLMAARNRTDALSAFEELLREDVKDVLRGVEWLIRQPFVDPERIGLVGVSMGALIGSVVAGTDTRIRGAVLILGGGDLAGILFSSKEPTIVALRKRIEEEEDFSRKELIAEAERRLYHVDPLTYAFRLDPGRILMINAQFDRVIKRRYSKKLWEAAGHPPMILLPAGHYTAGLFFGYAEKRMLDHFRKRLATEDNP